MDENVPEWAGMQPCTVEGVFLKVFPIRHSRDIEVFVDNVFLRFGERADGCPVFMSSRREDRCTEEPEKKKVQAATVAAGNFFRTRRKAS